MANHKRRRPKNQRRGCLLCKPWKGNNAKNKEKASVKRKLQDDGPQKVSTEKEEIQMRVEDDLIHVKIDQKLNVNDNVEMGNMLAAA